ncbi:hypothetical protein C8J57DRAFT_1532426 [Mycena rebaudengoi]|nr:hypothetical protein C8J57DRAFT_1532426 [Mycena rebaudengoi]
MAVGTQWIRAALTHYKPSQKKYDADSNEWDLCTLFDEDELRSSMEEPYCMGKEDIDNLPAALTTESTMNTEERPGVGFQGCVADMLGERYGFTMPQTDVPPLPNSEKWNEVCKILGLPDEPMHAKAEGHLWDLDNANAYWPPLHDLLEKSVWVVLGEQTAFSLGVDGTLWRDESKRTTMYEMVPEESAPWVLSFTSALSLVHAIRLTQMPGMSLEALVGHLFQYGIPFTLRTTLPAISPLPPIRSVQETEFAISIRSVGYKYKVEDYVAYESFCVRLLNEPHGRAALLMGGIVWHIAVEVLGLDHILAGPSASVTQKRVGTCLENTWDDALSPLEADMICGLHEQDTGNVSKEGVRGFAKVSWWPTHETWNSASCGKNPG